MTTQRKMTPNGFLFKTTTKAAASAKGFIEAYREYLTKGEVAGVTAPIVAKLDRGEILPTPALEEIKDMVFAHIMQANAELAQKSLERSQDTGPSLPFEAMIVDPSGKVMSRIKDDGSVEPLEKEFDLPQNAERWIDRRLFDGAVNWTGIILHNGKKYDVICRDDSIARILKQPKGSVCRTQAKSTSKLGWGTKCKEKAVKFSRG
jgi:hypothetical protein